MGIIERRGQRFDDAAQAWWDARVTRLRPATQSAYAAGLGHLRHRFGRARMADITPADVAAFITEQQRAGLKGWTVRGQITALSSIFTYAARHLGLVGVNPVSLLDRVERAAQTTSAQSGYSPPTNCADCSTPWTSPTG